MKKNLPNFLVKQLKNNQISIFLFHGVFKRNNFLIRNYTNKHIHENVFEKCIDNLKKNANPLSMHDVLQIYEKQKKILIDEKLDSLFYSIEMPLINVLANMENNELTILERGIVSVSGLDANDFLQNIIT